MTSWCRINPSRCPSACWHSASRRRLALCLRFARHTLLIPRLAQGAPHARRPIACRRRVAPARPRPLSRRRTRPRARCPTSRPPRRHAPPAPTAAACHMPSGRRRNSLAASLSPHRQAQVHAYKSAADRGRAALRAQQQLCSVLAHSHRPEALAQACLCGPGAPAPHTANSSSLYRKARELMLAAGHARADPPRRYI